MDVGTRKMLGQFFLSIGSNMKTGTKYMLYAAAISASLCAILIVGPAAGQQAPDHAIEQATFRSPAADDAAKSVRFSRRSARVGDEVEQNIGLELRMTMSMRQENQLVGKNQTTVRTNQRRVMTTTAVDNG